jgi:hypothetical protein
MRIIRNERRIKVSHSIGQYATMGGMVVLIGGLIISFTKPEWFAITVGSLALGFILSIVGSFFLDRFVGPHAHHDALAAALKGLDDRYTLFQYVLPATQVLLGPGGCTVFLIKTQGGQVTYQERGRWKHGQRGKFFRQFAGQEAVGAPDLDAELQTQKLNRWLSSQLPDVEIPIRPAIVFVNPDVKLDADGSSVPTFYGKKVKSWIRGPGKLKPLPDATYRQLAETLEAGK